MWDHKTHFVISHEARAALSQPLPNTDNLKALPRNRTRLARFFISQQGAHPHIYWGPAQQQLGPANWWDTSFPREAVVIQLLRAALFCHGQGVLIGHKFLLTACRLVPNVDVPLLQLCDWSQARFFAREMASSAEWADERRSVWVACSKLLFPWANPDILWSCLKEAAATAAPFLTARDKARLLTALGMRPGELLSPVQTHWARILETSCTGPVAWRTTLEGVLQDDASCQDVREHIERRYPWIKPKKRVRFQLLQTENKAWKQIVSQNHNHAELAPLLATATCLAQGLGRSTDLRAALWVASLLGKSSVHVQNKGIKSLHVKQILQGVAAATAARPSSHELALQMARTRKLDIEEAIHVCFVAAVLYRGYVGEKALFLAALWLGGQEEQGDRLLPLSKKQWWWRRWEELYQA